MGGRQVSVFCPTNKSMAKQNIMVVEDEVTLHDALLEYLKAEGFETVSAMDGEEALIKVKSEKPDLVLLDIILPKKDGYEVLEELKKDEATKNIPVILLTNLGSNDDIQKAFDRGQRPILSRRIISWKMWSKK
jgi:CheY-like chemotaxis protein